MTKPIHRKIRWTCPLCDDVVYSDSTITHTVDYCRCKKTGVDLELHYCRTIGNKPKTFEEIKVRY